jgi:molybdate transport system substrate-binding protein
MSMPASPAVTLFAAGSLRAALSEVAKAFEAENGGTVECRFGPSGLLAAEIASGTRADLFASANMAHPRALHEAGMAGPVMCFAHNTLCALARPGLQATSATLLNIVLDPKIKIATSTPKADPSGDYAFEVFRKAEAIKAGAQAALERKALKLTGAKDSVPPPEGRVVYGWHLAEGRADIFLTYRTNALAAQQQYPAQKCVNLPDALAVGADYGLAVMKDAPVGAQTLAHYILSASGQTILARHGFAPPAP